MLTSEWVLIFQCQSEIDHIYDTLQHLKKRKRSYCWRHTYLVSSSTDKEILRLEVAMNKAARVHKFQARDHLVSEKQNSLQSKLSIAELEKII